MTLVNVSKKKIAGCLACEYCHTKGEGNCVQKDDFEKILPAYREADMIVFASPIYYFSMNTHMQAAIQRVYCIGKPLKATKAALLLSSGSDGVYDSAIAQFEDYMDYAGIENVGVITAHGSENQSRSKLDEVREFAKSL